MHAEEAHPCRHFYRRGVAVGSVARDPAAETSHRAHKKATDTLLFAVVVKLHHYPCMEH